jgi:hypothetical protein
MSLAFLWFYFLKWLTFRGKKKRVIASSFYLINSFLGDTSNLLLTNIYVFNVYCSTSLNADPFLSKAEPAWILEKKPFQLVFWFNPQRRIQTTAPQTSHRTNTCLKPRLLTENEQSKYLLNKMWKWDRPKWILLAFPHADC